MEHPYIDNLIQNCKQAKMVEPIRRYEITSIEELSNLPRIGNSIYLIQEINGNKNITFDQFEMYKSRKERACAKLNKSSELLYVGSSTTGVKNRLKQHLEEGSKGTYALHMNNWFKGRYKFEILEFDVGIEILQIIEDSISFNLKPAFGKQGRQQQMICNFFGTPEEVISYRGE